MSKSPLPTNLRLSPASPQSIIESPLPTNLRLSPASPQNVSESPPSATMMSIEEAPPRKTPKHVLCKHCNIPFYKTPGHTQFQGKKYCPKVEKTSKSKWLAKQREDIGILPCMYTATRALPGAMDILDCWGTFIAPKNTRGFQLVHGEKRYGVCALQNQQRGKTRRMQKKEREVSRCSKCNELLKGHGTHFRGQRYCPNVPGQIPLEEWLTQKQMEFER